MDRKKQKYGIVKTTRFMIGKAMKEAPAVLVRMLLSVMVALGISLLELYVVPTLLAQITDQIELKKVVISVLLFSGGMMLCSGLKNYLEESGANEQIQVRTAVLQSVEYKAATTSYCNLGRKDFQEKLDKSLDALDGNWSPTERIWDNLYQLLLNIMGFVLYLFIMRRVNEIILLLTVATALISYAATAHATKWRRQNLKLHSRALKRERYLENQIVSEASAKDIRILQMQTWLLDIMKKEHGEIQRFHRKKYMKKFQMDTVSIGMSLLRNGVAYVYLIGQVLNGSIDAVAFVLYFTAVSGFTKWVTGIMDTFGKIKFDSVGLSDIMEFLEYEETFRFEDGISIRHETNMQYEFVLENVSFRYPGASEDTLKNVNLTIRKGEKLAVVGRNGAGKTTLVKILCGLYDPTEGRVLLNGKDIKQYNRKDYYNLFSAVFQDFSLLPGSIAENVAQNGENPDMERVKTAIKKAGLEKKILSLPEQYDTKLNKSVYLEAYDFSGGEIQRLLLARALYRNAPIIVLDEPTAALDPIAESDFYDRYHQLTSLSTSIYVSHRLASTKFCDRIILIGEGGIAEIGSHDELMEAGGAYATLYNVQSQYYREGGCENEAV